MYLCNGACEEENQYLSTEFGDLEFAFSTTSVCLSCCGYA